MNKKVLSVCNVFLILLLLNDVTSLFFVEASIGSRLLYYSLIAISFYYWVNIILHTDKIPPLLKAWSILLILFTAYGIPLIISGKTFFIKESFRHIGGEEFLKLIYYSMLPLFPIYEFTRRGELSLGKLKILCVLLLLVSTYQYYEYYTKMLFFAEESGLTITEFTNNTGYLFLQILPLLLVFRRRKIVMTSILVYCIYMIINGMKRGAILLAIPCVLILLLSLYKLSTSKQKVLIIFIAFIVGVSCIELVQYMLATSDYFNMRLEATLSGNSSNRDIIYAQAINVFLNESNIFETFFGHGGYSTLDLMMNNAHNDWLEILVNHGLIGILVFIYLCFQLCRATKQAKRYDPYLFALMQIVTIIFIGRSIFSMAYSDMGHGLIIAMGYGIAQLQQKMHLENKLMVIKK